jgi:gremlin
MTVLLVLSMLTLHATGHRVHLSDSILDIINTKNVERMIAERRANASRDEKRFLLQNDVGDETAEPENGDLYHNTPEVIDFDFSSRRQNPMRGDVLHYNETIPYSPNAPPTMNGDILADLQAYRGDKLLKSSKNALIVTRKEYLKKDWCKTEPLVQRIREEGCLSRTIINRFCYGQCNSFYIPKSPKRRRAQNNRPRDSGDFEDEDLTGAAFRSCAFCKPKKFTWITVTLRCPSMVPQLRRKRIQRIKQCKCIAEPLN